VLFAQGDELAAMQKECSGRAKEWAKFTIQNDVEVIDPKTKIWRVVAKDVGRMQTPMEKGEKLPGDEIIKYFPKTKTNKNTRKEVEIHLI
jgi:hypothetical protein